MPVVVYRLIPAGGFYFELFPYYLKFLICCSLSWISDIFPNINSGVCAHLATCQVSIVVHALPTSRGLEICYLNVLITFFKLKHVLTWDYVSRTSYQLWDIELEVAVEKSKVCWYAWLCDQTLVM